MGNDVDTVLRDNPGLQLELGVGISNLHLPNPAFNASNPALQGQDGTTMQSGLSLEMGLKYHIRPSTQAGNHFDINPGIGGFYQTGSWKDKGGKAYIDFGFHREGKFVFLFTPYFSPKFVHQTGGSDDILMPGLGRGRGQLASTPVNEVGIGLSFFWQTGDWQMGPKFSAGSVSGLKIVDDNQRTWEMPATLKTELLFQVAFQPMHSEEAVRLNPESAKRQIHDLKRNWETRELPYQVRGLEFVFGDNTADGIVNLLKDLDYLQRGGNMPGSNVRLQLIGHSKTTGDTAQDGLRAFRALGSLQSEVEARLKTLGLTSRLVGTVLLPGVIYGDTRLDKDVVRVRVLVDEMPETGQDINELIRRDQAERLKIVQSQLTSLKSTIENIRFNFAQAVDASCDYNPSDQPQGLQTQINSLLSSLEQIKVNIDGITDQEAKKRYLQSLRLQILGFARNPAWVDPYQVSGYDFASYDTDPKNNLLPQCFLEVGKGRAESVYNKILSAIEANSVFPAETKAWMKQVLQIPRVAPLPLGDRKITLQLRYGYGGIGMAGPAMQGGYAAVRTQDRVIKIEGSMEENCANKDQNLWANEDRVALKIIFPDDQGKIKPFCTPSLTFQERMKIPTAAPRNAGPAPAGRGPNNPPPNKGKGQEE